MGHTVTLILLTVISQQIRSLYGDLSVPFTHDFNTSLHGWNVGNEVWHWTGNSKNIPGITNIPFDRESNYIWSQNSYLATGRISQHQLLYSQFVTNVTGTSKFHFKYWFYTSDVRCGFLSFSLVTKEGRGVTKTVTHNSNNGWDDVTIDCQVDNCCQVYNCDLRSFITGPVRCSNAEDLIMIRSVSATVSEKVKATKESKLDMDHKTDKPEDNTIPEGPLTSSTSTKITSNNSTITSRGPTTVPGRLIKRYRQNQLNKRHTTLLVNTRATRQTPLNSARKFPLHNEMPSKSSSFDQRLNKLMRDLQNNNTIRIRRSHPLTEKLDETDENIPIFDWEKFDRETEERKRILLMVDDLNLKPIELKFPTTKNPNEWDERTIVKLSLKVGGPVLTLLITGIIVAYLKCKKMRQNDESADTPV